MFPPFFLANQRGIPRIASNSVSVTSTSVNFDFTRHGYLNSPFRGLLIFKLAQEIPTGTTTTLPVVFTSGGQNPMPVTTLGGNAWTVGDVGGTGIYVFYYDNVDNVLQVLNAV